jgi:hypothetical protein
LEDRNPLARWTIERSTRGNISSPRDALSFLSSPIQKVFSHQNGNIRSAFQYLSILASRYEYKIIRATDVNWHKPFSTSFSFFESTRKCSQQELAISLTRTVAKLLICFSAQDILSHTARVRRVGEQWTSLCEDVRACAAIMEEAEQYFLTLAQVC